MGAAQLKLHLLALLHMDHSPKCLVSSKLLSFGTPHSTCTSVLSALLRLTTELWHSTLHSPKCLVSSTTPDYWALALHTPLAQVSCQLYAWLLSFGAPHSTRPLSALSALCKTTLVLHTPLDQVSCELYARLLWCSILHWPSVLSSLHKTTLVLRTPYSTQPSVSNAWAHTSAVGGSPKCYPLFIWFVSFKN